MNGKTYNLLYPVTWDGGEVKTLTLGRPKMKHFKKIGTNPSVQDMMNIAAAVSGMVPPFFDELDAADGIAIVGIVSDFLDVTPETGNK